MIHIIRVPSHQIKFSFILLILISNIGSFKRQSLNACFKHLLEILIKIIIWKFSSSTVRIFLNKDFNR
jgi:hypothetical protein